MTLPALWNWLVEHPALTTALVGAFVILSVFVVIGSSVTVDTSGMHTCTTACRCYQSAD